MSYKTLLLGLSCALALSACGSDSPKSSSKSTTYSYNFRVGGCAPSVFKGRFSTFAEMCQALQYQAQLYPCASPHILRHLEDKNCHRSDFLHMNPTVGGSPQTLTQPGVFYNEYQERYILTPQGPVRLESPNLHDEQMQEAYAQSYLQTEVDRLICEHGVCRKPEQKLEIRNGKVYLDGVLAYDPSFDPSNVYGPNHPYFNNRQEEDDSVYGPNHHEYKGGTSTGNTSSTLIRPDQQKPAENRNSNAGTDSSPRRTETVATTPVTPTPVTRETPQTTNEEPQKEIPRPEPRPQTPVNQDNTTTAQHEEPTTKTPEVTETLTDSPAETDSTEARPEKDTAPAPTAEGTPATETPTSEEEVSDVSNEVQPQNFNLIYFTATGAMYTEIPNPQNQQRFPILKITAKIDSRSPLHNKKHSQPIKDLDVEILTAESTTACHPIAQISSNNDIMILTLKTKDQTDVSQLQSCKDWFQVIRKNSFEIQTSELQTDKGVISGKFNFVLSQ